MVTVWPDDFGQLARIGTTDHAELHLFVVLLEESRDIGTVLDRIHPHVGMAPPQLVDVGLQARPFADHQDTGAWRSLASSIAA